MPHQCLACPVWYGAEDDEYGPCLVKSSRGDLKRVTHGAHVCDEVAHISFVDTVLDIRPMTAADLDFAVRITNSVGWAYTKEDLALLRSYEPEGNIVATEDGRPVGMLSATSYGDVGWIGNVVTDEAVRGRGFGLALMKAATEHLESKGATSIVLYAYEDTVAFYERQGFERIGEGLQFVGRGTEGGPPPDGPEAADIDSILALDRDVMGFPRDRVLSTLWSRYRDSFVVQRRGGDVVGYAVGLKGNREGEVGPWICGPGSDHESLFDDLLAVVGPAEVVLTIPGTNATAIAAVKRRGFHAALRTVLMVKGEVPSWREDGIFAMGSLEKG